MSEEIQRLETLEFMTCTDIIPISECSFKFYNLWHH